MEINIVVLKEITQNKSQGTFNDYSAAMNVLDEKDQFITRAFTNRPCHVETGEPKYPIQTYLKRSAQRFCEVLRKQGIYYPFKTMLGKLEAAKNKAELYSDWEKKWATFNI